ncbi:MAG: alpha/beta hydrolase [Acetobacterium sp. MES1]|uniref:alpha/beta fold hydrolase n=1 Tax=Acetobacterium TaxID=33951 RepID=UPI000B9CCC1A|nr:MULTISPECIES: alpha/beta hydrolase [unclassified Acetobacterium]OXS24421.1 MAG: alpha/beta hydrolase [Acetobacterium sp. MES1]
MVRVEDISMSYQVYGSGYPLLLIMGYGGTMNLWEERFLRSLSKKYKVIVFDNRGMGETSSGHKPFTIEQFAEDTYEMLVALKIESAHVLGWSMGASIAQELALRHPEIVNKLILYASLCHPEIFPPEPKVLFRLENTLGIPSEKGYEWLRLIFPPEWIKNNPDRIREIFHRPLGVMNPDSILKQADAINKWEGSCNRIPFLKHETLVIDGKDDLILPSENAEYLASRLPNSKLILIPEAGHGLMFQKPDKFTLIINLFLD